MLVGTIFTVEGTPVVVSTCVASAASAFGAVRAQLVDVKPSATAMRIRIFFILFFLFLSCIVGAIMRTLIGKTDIAEKSYSG